LQVLSYVMIAAVIVLGFLVPKAYIAPVGVLMLALGLAWFGAFEWFRESARKPYVIYDYMYGNAVRVDDVEAWKKDGLLTHVAFKTDDPGADLFRLTCRHCHTLDGYNPIKPALDNTDATWITGTVLNTEQMRWHMPPFPGTDDEARILGDWLWGRVNQRPLADAMGLEGAELGAAVWDRRCSSCHMFDGHNDKSKQLATYEAEDLQGLLEDEDGLEGMPVFTEMPEKETQALLEWLAAEGRLGGGE
jgi:mono/diheme cytochrome c family protein